MSAKYPRTPHLPSSPGGTRDDRRLSDLSSLVGVEVVITEKLDGSNLALTSEAVFARSHAGPPAHPSFARAKAVHAQVRAGIPAGVSVFAEYCFAVHSIAYPDLPTEAELSVFGVRDDARGQWWAWDDVVALAKSLGLATVPLLDRGVWSSSRALEERVECLMREPSRYGPEREGVVVRVARGFSTDELGAGVLAKCVRADHVQTDEHWSRQQIRRHRSG